MSAIGSVFLGDFQRLRLLSSSTPPSSPPPTGTSMSSVFPALQAQGAPPHSPSVNPPHDSNDTPESHPDPHSHGPTLPDSDAPVIHPPPVIEPMLALELRLRWLEAILLGVRDEKGKNRDREREREREQGETLSRAAEDIQRQLNSFVEGNDGLKRFMESYEQHAHLLTPSFALTTPAPAPEPPSYDLLSPYELEAYLTEMEPDVRAADRDMLEIEALEERGVTAAGKLPDYEALQPRLVTLLKSHQEDARLAASLEKRIDVLMEQHATHVDALSELFVVWDDTITEAENKVARLEREKVERQRLGFE